MYPTEEYQAKLAESMSASLANLDELTSIDQCTQVKNPYGEDPTIFTDYLEQTPYDVGDYGYKASFTVECWITQDGKVHLPNIIESDFPKLNDEVLRIVRSMPKWEVENCEDKKYKTKVQFPIVIDQDLAWE